MSDFLTYLARYALQPETAVLPAVPPRFAAGVSIAPSELTPEPPPLPPAEAMTLPTSSQSTERLADLVESTTHEASKTPSDPMAQSPTAPPLQRKVDPTAPPVSLEGGPPLPHPIATGPHPTLPASIQASNTLTPPPLPMADSSLTEPTATTITPSESQPVTPPSQPVQTQQTAVFATESPTTEPIPPMPSADTVPATPAPTMQPIQRKIDPAAVPISLEGSLTPHPIAEVPNQTPPAATQVPNKPTAPPHAPAKATVPAAEPQPTASRSIQQPTQQTAVFAMESPTIDSITPAPSPNLNSEVQNGPKLPPTTKPSPPVAPHQPPARAQVADWLREDLPKQPHLETPQTNPQQNVVSPLPRGAAHYVAAPPSSNTEPLADPPVTAAAQKQLTQPASPPIPLEPQSNIRPNLPPALAPAPTPEAAASQPQETAVPTVHITIGRIVLKAPPSAPTAPPPAPARRQPSVSLSDYLTRHGGKQ